MSEYTATEAASATVVQPFQGNHGDSHVLDGFAWIGLGDSSGEGGQADLDWRVPGNDPWTSRAPSRQGVEGTQGEPVGEGRVKSFLLDNLMTIMAVVLSVSVGLVATVR